MIKPVARGLKWKPGFDVRIDGDREATIERARQDAAEIKIHTDGSGHSRGIRAAATLT